MFNILVDKEVSPSIIDNCYDNYQFEDSLVPCLNLKILLFFYPRQAYYLMAFDESAVVWKHLNVEARGFVSKANKRGGGTQRRIQRKDGNLSPWTLQLIDIEQVEEL